MVSQAEIDRLRREADAIMTRRDEVDAALREARNEAGDHWETGELDLTIDTPRGEPIEVTLDLETDATANASARYERAKELELELERRRNRVGKLAPVPSDPVAYRLCYHLSVVGADDPRSIAGALDADHDRVAELCESLATAGLLERRGSAGPSAGGDGDTSNSTTDQYWLSEEGDRLLAYLEAEFGRSRVIRHLPNAETVLRRLSRGGPDYPRMTAEELELDLEAVRHLYKALQQVGLVTEYRGSTIKGTERKLKPKDETHRKHTYYVTTDVADALVRELGE